MADDDWWRTIDVGYVHVLTEPGGPCRDDCPHPDHRAVAGARECPLGGPLCPASICDCFIEQYPEDPLGLHPEAFVVMVPCSSCGAVGLVGGSVCEVCGWDRASRGDA